jgi:hypothetical protein
MLKLINKLNVRILIAIVFGFLVASTFTHFQGPCTSTIQGEDSSHCVEFSKAVMHPRDLINNKQDTLTKFAGTFAISSLVGFALLTAYSQFQTKKKA